MCGAPDCLSYTPYLKRLRQISDNKPNTITSLPNLPPDKTNIVKYFLIFFNREEILEIFQYFHNMGLCQYDKGNIVRGTELAQLLVIHLIYSEIYPFQGGAIFATLLRYRHALFNGYTHTFETAKYRFKGGT